MLIEVIARGSHKFHIARIPLGCVYDGGRVLPRAVRRRMLCTREDGALREQPGREYRCLKHAPQGNPRIALETNHGELKNADGPSVLGNTRAIFLTPTNST